VATDTLNPDPTPTERATPDEPSGVPAHRALLGAGRLVVENLTGLERLPERVTLHAYPLAVDADGAPVRAVAEVDEDREPAADRGSDAPRDETAGG
jgi:kynurenine formamidase